MTFSPSAKAGAERTLSTHLLRAESCQTRKPPRCAVSELGERGEKRLRFRKLGKLRRRRKAFERGGEDAVGFERVADRMIELRQRQRRAQLERTRALFAGDCDGRLQIAAGAIWIRWSRSMSGDGSFYFEGNSRLGDVGL